MQHWRGLWKRERTGTGARATPKPTSCAQDGECLPFRVQGRLRRRGRRLRTPRRPGCMQKAPQSVNGCPWRAGPEAILEAWARKGVEQRQARHLWRVRARSPLAVLGAGYGGKAISGDALGITQGGTGACLTASGADDRAGRPFRALRPRNDTRTARPREQEQAVLEYRDSRSRGAGSRRGRLSRFSPPGGSSWRPNPCCGISPPCGRT